MEVDVGMRWRVAMEVGRGLGREEEEEAVSVFVPSVLSFFMLGLAQNERLCIICCS